MKTSLDDVLAELAGQRCQQIDNPVGSVVRLDFGELSIAPGAPPGERPHGWRHLTVLSPWRIESEHVVVCDWSDPGGVNGVLPDLIQVLSGRVLINASCSPPAFDLLLQFSDGYRLFVFSDLEDVRDESWYILGNDGLKIVAAPQRSEEGGLSIGVTTFMEAPQ